MFMDPNFPPPDQVSGRLAQFMRLVNAFERDEMEAGVDLLIAALDARDGDTDLEPNGDEEDHTHAEDEIGTRNAQAIGAGCAISDAAEMDDEDYGAEEPGEGGSWPEDGGADGRACIGDDDDEDDAPALRRPFRDMIRRERCVVEKAGTTFDGQRWIGYRLHGIPKAPLGIMAS